MRVATVVATAAAVVAASSLAVGLPVPSGGPADKAVPAEGSTEAGRRRPVVLGVDGRRLFKLNPRTLRRLPARAVPVGALNAWAFAGDRSRIVLGDLWPAALRFVDLERMRSFADEIVLAGDGSVVAAAWPALQRVLAVVQTRFRSGRETAVYVVDPVAGRVLARGPLRGSIQSIGRFRGGLVLVLGPSRSVGASRLAVVDRRGTVRAVALPRTLSGQAPARPHGTRLPEQERRPGLALDPVRGRAYVVGAGEPAAEVDLRSFDVDYHELSEPVSLFGRLRHWLEPEAHADYVPEGPIRQALWLGGDRIAVAGSDSRYVRGRYRHFASGLKLIDTHSWTVRTVDERVMNVTLAADTLLATGPHRTDPEAPIGLIGYSPEGERSFQLFAGREVFPSEIVGRRAFIHLGREWPEVNVVDVQAGRVLGSRDLKWGVVDAERESPTLPWLPRP